MEGEKEGLGQGGTRGKKKQIAIVALGRERRTREGGGGKQREENGGSLVDLSGGEENKKREGDVGPGHYQTSLHEETIKTNQPE